jgi:hypothetical protein
MKILVFVLVLSLFFLGIGYAEPLEIQIFKDSYAAGETLQARIIVNDIENEIKISDIKLMRGNSYVSITPFLLRLGKDYFVYFHLPVNLEGGNYSLVVEDVVYYRNDLLVQGDFSKGFSVVDKDFVIRVDPGILIANNLENINNFDVRLVNFGDSVLVNFSVSDNLISLSDDAIYLSDEYALGVYVSELLKGSAEGYLKMEYGGDNYLIPIWFGAGSENVSSENISYIDNESNQSVNVSDGFNDTEQNISVSEGVYFLSYEKELVGVILENGGQYLGLDIRNFYNDSLDVSFYLEGNISEIAELEENSFELGRDEIGRVGLLLNKEEMADIGGYNGYLVLDSGINSDRFYLEIYVIEVGKEIVVNESSGDIYVDKKNLSEYMEGKEEKKGSKIWYWIFFGFLFALLLVIIYILYLRHQKKSRPGFPF